MIKAILCCDLKGGIGKDNDLLFHNKEDMKFFKENETHTLFIGRLVEADMFDDNKPMSYEYYQDHKEELVKVKTEKIKKPQ